MAHKTRQEMKNRGTIVSAQLEGGRHIHMYTGETTEEAALSKSFKILSTAYGDKIVQVEVAKNLSFEEKIGAIINMFSCLLTAILIACTRRILPR